MSGRPESASVSVVDPPPLITECPNCHTRFRVGESQLQMAHGRVRCGACLAVFAGVDHLLLDESAAAPELPGQPDALDSVLAELAIDPTSTDEIKVPGDDVQNPAAVDTDHDWTAVSVDTREFDREETLEVSGARGAVSDTGKETEAGSVSEPRATIEDALNDEEALRWWLEDELPGEDGSAQIDDPTDSDEMVVQLSQFDEVQDEELDLRSLVESMEDSSNAKVLQELFEQEPFDEVISEPALKPDTPIEPPLAQPTSPEPKPAAAKPAVPKPAAPKTAAPGKVAAPEKVDPLELAQTDLAASAEGSANDLQAAIDKAEPLVSKALANGTIAAAAERMNASKAARSEATEPASRGAVALVKSPHTPKPAAPEIASEAVHEESGSLVTEAQAPAAIPEQVRDPWAADAIAETPAEMVRGIAEEMAAAGSAVDHPGANSSEKAGGPLQRFFGQILVLRIAIALAFILLTGQILYWQFSDWAKTDAMRPVYAGICSVIGCELPVRRSLRDLQSRKLAVRSHPEQDGALLVDALIINEAPFEQPFPIIELQFMDINQQLVGSYRLEPSSYLDGELAGSEVLMAVRTPVHIDIDIPDPGPKAVNYQLQFR